MEEKIKLNFNDCTLSKMYKLFGIKQTWDTTYLDDWLDEQPELTPEEILIAKHYQKRLLENLRVWNEQELSLHFIGPILNLIDFTIPYQMNLFAQRNISAEIGNYVLQGKPDGMIASGYDDPEMPYFCFQEYKKELDNSGDPAGQVLAAMFAGHIVNAKPAMPIYGCYVIGRLWYFMVLLNNTYAISKEYSAASEDILAIVRILKSLQRKVIILSRLDN